MSINHPWYLIHPIREDDQYTIKQNLDHISKIQKMFLLERIPVIAPYQGMCSLNLTQSQTARDIGIAIDCAVIKKFGRAVAVGHRWSSGMVAEMLALEEEDDHQLLDLVGVKDRKLLTAFIEECYVYGFDPYGHRERTSGASYVRQSIVGERL